MNYHGGSNFGLEWVESICCGNYYDLERVDLEAGVDYVIGRGLADPEKLGTMGWSNGAILTTELVTRSRRFKVASAGAGDVEWISDWGNVDFGASFDNYYFGKAPYEDPELYVRKSPYFRLKDVTTPTILYTGTDDRNVPPSQSWSHFRVLQQATKTPVRFVLFPGEPHGLQKYVHQKRKVEEDLAWFDAHLFGTQPADPAVKEGSPLEAALERKGFAQQGGLYGRTVKGKLVPEAVAYEGLQVARFEVTRAQYAAFDPKQRVAPGTGNLPASGRHVRARRRPTRRGSPTLTGEKWRLPSAEEAKTLYGERPRGREHARPLGRLRAEPRGRRARARARRRSWAGRPRSSRRSGATRAAARDRRSTTSAGTWPSGRWARTARASSSAAAPTGPRARAARGRRPARPTAASGS